MISLEKTRVRRLSEQIICAIGVGCWRNERVYMPIGSNCVRTIGVFVKRIQFSKKNTRTFIKTDLSRSREIKKRRSCTVGKTKKT